MPKNNKQKQNLENFSLIFSSTPSIPTLFNFTPIRLSVPPSENTHITVSNDSALFNLWSSVLIPVTMSRGSFNWPLLPPRKHSDASQTSQPPSPPPASLWGFSLPGFSSSHFPQSSKVRILGSAHGPLPVSICHLLHWWPHPVSSFYCHPWLLISNVYLQA